MNDTRARLHRDTPLTGISFDEPQLAATVSTDLQRVEELLMSELNHGEEFVNEKVIHLAAAGGKRFRPMFAILASQLGPRASCAEVIKAATVVEMTHLATLYHDDVMDSAPSRRGAPAAQRIWGNNRAILAGDVLFSRASRRVAKLGPEAVAQHATTFERLCMGQLNETFGPAEDEDAVAFYLQVLADKTGSLVAQSARYGAEMSGAGPEVANYVAEYGEKVGVAFQIADDVIDLASDPKTSGKTPGTDLREGVDTLPTLLLKAQAANGEIDEAGERILHLLEQDLSDDAALAEVVSALREHPVLEQTRQMAREWAAEAKQILDALPKSDAHAALCEFADLLVDRMS